MYDIRVKTDIGEYFYSGSCLYKTPVIIAVFTRNGSSRIEFFRERNEYSRQTSVRPGSYSLGYETLESIEVNGKIIYKNTKKY